MRKSSTKFLVLLFGIIFSFIFTIISTPQEVYAFDSEYSIRTHETDYLQKSNEILSEEKVYFSGTIEEEFEDDKVIVVLTKEATNQFRDYSPNDFSEVNCISVKDLTEYTMDYLGKKVNTSSKEETMLVNTEKFKRILSLELEEKNKENVINAIKILERRDDILSATPNYIQKMLSLPNDPKFSDQWGLSKISAPAAWDISTGSSTVNVGIVDTGIDGNHNDLKNRLNSEGLHMDFSVKPAITVATPTDPIGHGTHVAGIIGAEGNNSIGITGVAWNVRLISLKVFDSKGNATNDSLIRAINFASSQNIPILNLSLGGPTYDTALKNAIIGYSGLIVCAAGNSNKNIDIDSEYPASYVQSNILTVGASDSNDIRSDWSRPDGFWNLWGLLGSIANAKSNYGEYSVDVFAPGTSIYSTLPNNSYGSYDGTSMAAPFVTGVAALIKSKNPYIQTWQIIAIILNYVDTVDAFDGLCVTGGRLNAYKALDATPLHSHSYSYSYHSNENHKLICECGDSKIEAHRMQLINGSYKCSTCGWERPFDVVNVFNLSCHSTQSEVTSVSAEVEIFYKININCNSNYEILSSANDSIEMSLYDINMNLISSSPNMLSNNTIAIFNRRLQAGTYYLKLNFASSYVNGDITTTIKSTELEQIWIGSNKNVLTHLHNGFNKYVFYNNYNSQFVNLTLSAIKNGGMVTYPEGVIIVKDYNGNILEKINLDGFYNPAQNKNNVNSLIVFLPYLGKYEIEVHFTDTNISSLMLNLSSIESYEKDLFTLSESTNTNISNFSNISKGDEMQKITLKQAGRFNFAITGLNDSTFIIIKERIRVDGEIYYDTIYAQPIGNNFSETKDLVEGIYYIGYINADKGQTISINITREVTQHGDYNLLPDPLVGFISGSEVNLNGGNKEENTITQGFTRLIYLASGDSRLDYYWYSSNLNVAIITDYGTVLGLPVTQDTAVKIMAVKRNDPSIVFIKEIIIKKDLKTFESDPIVYNLSMTVTAGSGEIQSIDISSLLVPINLLQHYNWSSNSSLVSVDSWGRIYAYPNAIGQAFIITGNYKFNSRVKIYVNITVV